FRRCSAICALATTAPRGCLNKWSRPAWCRPCSPTAIVKSWRHRVDQMKSKHVMARWAASVILAASPLVAWSANAPQQLAQFIAQVQSATGHFTQQRIDEKGQGTPAQSGQFSFKRPGQFKWAVKQPYEQLIVSDGKQVY